MSPPFDDAGPNGSVAPIAKDYLLADYLADAARWNVQFAADIVRKLREQASETAAERKPECPRDIIREAVQLCDSRVATEAAVIVEVDPKADSVLIDRVQIEQVVLNLLRNAREAQGNSASNAKIRISASPANANMTFVRVSDGGGGICDAVKEDIFEASFTTNPRGMGLGLSICRAIVENHGGRIWFEANDRGGADFCFKVPSVAGGKHRSMRA